MGRAARPWVLVLLLGLAACGDDPFLIRWVESPDTVRLYSLARPEFQLPSAFDFIGRGTVRIETPNATGQWDMALDTREGELVLLPPGALGVESRARIAALPGLTFTEVEEAPRDSAAYATAQPVPLALNSVYVVRTGARNAGRCVYYAKLEPLEIDVGTGMLRFVFDASPVCNDPRLIPPN